MQRCIACLDQHRFASHVCSYSKPAKSDFSFRAGPYLHCAQQPQLVDLHAFCTHWGHSSPNTRVHFPDSEWLWALSARCTLRKSRPTVGGGGDARRQPPHPATLIPPFPFSPSPPSLPLPLSFCPLPPSLPSPSSLPLLSLPLSLLPFPSVTRRAAAGPAGWRRAGPAGRRAPRCAAARALLFVYQLLLSSY